MVLVAILVLMALLARAGQAPARHEALAGWARDSVAWTAAVHLGANAVRPLTLIPVTLLWILSGTLLGWGAGAAVSVVGTSLGAALGFALARRLGRDVVERRFPRLRRLGQVQPSQGLRTVLALQLTPVMPHDLINGFSGVSRMPYRSFFLGSLLGSLPLVVLYTYVGSAVLAVDTPRFWIAAVILSAFTVLMLAWNRKLARKRLGEPATDPCEEGR